MFTTIKRIFRTFQLRYVGDWLSHLRKKPWDLFILPAWILSNCRDRTPLEDEVPWITYGAVKWLSQNLHKQMDTFEYGCGGSTIFFGKRVRQHHAVEHDKVWYEIVKKTLDETGLSNVDLTLKLPSHTKDSDYGTTDRGLLGSSFREYVSFIDGFPDHSFDVILIDGRSRSSSVRHAIKKVRQGGYIVLDNSERSEYAQEIALLRSFERIDFFGPGLYNPYFWQTSIFRSPIK